MSHRQRGLASESRDLLEQVVALAGNDPSDRGLTRPAEVATLLRCALDALGAITGEVPPDDVLGLVFAEFCIGK
jgi:tRNA modification GTPase